MRTARAIGIGFVAVVGGCSSGPTRTARPEPAPTAVVASPGGSAPAPAPTPTATAHGTCEIIADKDSFTVDGERFPVAFAPGDGRVAISQIKLPGATFVVAVDGRQAWRVDCTQSPAVALLVASPGANLLSGKWTRDWSTLVYDDQDGIHALAPLTGVDRVIHQAPVKQLDDYLRCYEILTTAGDRADHAVTDLVARFEDDEATLVVTRTAPSCHYPSMFDVHIADWRDPAKATEHIARPIYDVRADRTGGLWMLDGGGLWRSRDRGDHWSKVKTRFPTLTSDTAMEEIGVWLVIDARQPARMVMRTSVRDSIGGRGSDFPGRLLRTSDSGKTWRVIPSPESDYPVSWMIAPDGDVAHLEVGLNEPSGDAPNLAAHTANSGGTWTFADETPPADADAETRTATIGDDTFEATNDGLFRTRAGVRERVSAPIAKPFTADVY